MDQLQNKMRMKKLFASALNDGPTFCPSRFLDACKEKVTDFKAILDLGYFPFLETLHKEFNYYSASNPQNNHCVDLLRWLTSSLDSLFNKISEKDRPATLYAVFVCIFSFFNVSAFWKDVTLPSGTVKKLAPTMLIFLDVVRFTIPDQVSIPINEQQLLKQYNDAVAAKDYATLEHLYPRFRIVSEQMEYASPQLALANAKHFLLNHDIPKLISFIDRIECGLYLRDFLLDIPIDNRLKLCEFTQNRDFIIQALFGERRVHDSIPQSGEAMSLLVATIDKLVKDDHYLKQVTRQITRRIIGNNYEDTLYAIGVYLANSRSLLQKMLVDNINIEISAISHKRYHARDYMLIAAGYINSKQVNPDYTFLNAIYDKWQIYIDASKHNNDLTLTEECRTNIDDLIRLFYYYNTSRAEIELNAALERIRGLHWAKSSQWFNSKMHYIARVYIALYEYTLCFQAIYARAKGVSPLDCDEPLHFDESCLAIKALYDSIHFAQFM